MWPNPQETPDLVTFTGEILNRKLRFCVVLTKEGQKYPHQKTVAKLWFYNRIEKKI